jgi:gamma-glutamyl-gamma-aminobutyrate hydrolase PuuD
MIIGLTQRVLYHKKQAYDSCDQAWYKFFGGHEIVTIKNDIKQDFESLADRIDILVITGGNDPTVRRITETKLATKMLVRKKPILGVCHGAFLLTDLLGGEIEENHDEHLDTEHLIVLGERKMLVNSHHNLVIKTPHRTASVIAKDLSGNCEAWIDDKMAGIVWHPERMERPFLPEEVQNLFI